MYHFCFVYIYAPNYYEVLSSLEELFISLVVTVNTFARVFILRVGIYIYIYALSVIEHFTRKI